MKNIIAIAAVALVGGSIMLSCTGKTAAKEEVAEVATYTNPVFNVDSPDPSVERGEDGTFYAFTTHGVRKSDDLVNWTDLGDSAFVERPSWSDICHNVWAYDCNKIGDKYVLYYALSKWAEEHANGIGVAVADSIQGPYTDMGKLFTSDEIGVQNSIDAQYFQEGGKNYLVWGSFSGIFCIELTDDGLKLAEGAKPIPFAGRAYEGSYIHKRDGKYYLFASIGSCCEGNNSTYTTVVGQADNFFGPYVNRAGEQMLDNKHEVVIAGTDQVKGPGHNSEIVTDDNGDDWILYHGYMAENPDNGRVLFLDKVEWVDGWPVVKDAQPSMTATAAPVFK